MYYSLLEKHNDGSWWYHKTTFRSAEDAYKFREAWTKWDKDGNKRLIEHEDTLPKETLWTFDFKHFYNIAGELLCTIKEGNSRV